MTQQSLTPWWKTDEYKWDLPVPAAFEGEAGPNGLALVRAWPDGRTDAGWGLLPGKSGKGFMDHYKSGDFNARRVVYGYERDKWAFAFVMRSVRMVCLDIDGKNGGFDAARKLMLPPTLAETSKSGDGYHLFFAVEDNWSDTEGFGVLGDRIGLEQGVDFRGTGCVYHHNTQRWNSRELVMLPQYIFDMVKSKEMRNAASSARVMSILANNDDMEVLMLKDELESELAKPIPAGKRNNTLFAIGSQMMTAGIADWDSQVHDRALDLGLGSDEADKLIVNISKYAPVSP